MDFLSNLTNTSVGNFFKSATSNLGSFFSGTTDKVGGFLGLSPKSLSKEKIASESFGSYGQYAQRNKNANISSFGSYQDAVSSSIGGPTQSVPGFSAFDKIKNSFSSGVGKKIVDRFTNPYSNVSGRLKETAKNFPTARNKTSTSGLGASSITPGFGFAPRATRRDALRNNQVAQAAIEAALANVKIQRTMLTAIKRTAPNITLAGTGRLAVKRKVV